MMSRLCILFVAAALIAASPAVLAADTTAQVVYDDGRAPESIPIFHMPDDEDAWFMRASDVARLFRATQFWNASSRKIVLGVGRSRFVLTVDTRVVVVDGDPQMMPADLTDPFRAPLNPDGTLFYKITNGKGNDMPAFKDKMTKDQIWSVVEYIKTLRKPEQ